MSKSSANANMKRAPTLDITAQLEAAKQTAEHKAPEADFDIGGATVVINFISSNVKVPTVIGSNSLNRSSFISARVTNALQNLPRNFDLDPIRIKVSIPPHILKILCAFLHNENSDGNAVEALTKTAQQLRKTNLYSLFISTEALLMPKAKAVICLVLSSKK